jgi:hypothetical protein
MQMQNSIIEQTSRPQFAKKVWVKPEVEIIDTDNIQSGNVPDGPEGLFTVHDSPGHAYHLS